MFANVKVIVSDSFHEFDNS